MNCDSWDDPKNAWITADTVRAFTRSSRLIFSGSVLIDMRSFTRRAMRLRADRELVRDQLADRTNAAVAQVVDVVDVAATFMQLDEVSNDLDEVFLREHGVVGRHGHAEPLVDLVAAHAAEVVALRREEQPLERLLRRLRVRRVARTEQRVDLRQRFLLAVRRILGQRVLDERRLGPARTRRTR